MGVVISDQDFGWIVGIIEGEGCFAVDEHGGNRRILVTSTDKWVVEKLKQLVDGNIGGPYTNPKKPHHKPKYHWILGKWEEVSLLTECLQPYLSPRRQEQAQKLLDNPPKKLAGKMSSRYKYVCFYKRNNKWRAQLQGKWLGDFLEEEQAASAVEQFLKGA